MQRWPRGTGGPEAAARRPAERASKTCCSSTRARTSTASSWKSAAGTGGDEAALFAGDLYDMYTHYARDKGWKVEDISFSPGEQGGFKEISLQRHRRRTSIRISATRAAAIACSACRRPKRRAAFTPRPPPSAVLPEPDEVQVDDPRPATSNGRRCAPAAPAASTSTRPKVAVRIWYQQGHRRTKSKSSARTNAASTRTTTAPCASCAAASSSAAGTLHQERADCAKHPDRLRRPQRTHPHLQLPAEPRHRSPHRPDPVQAGRGHGRRIGPDDRTNEGSHEKREAGGSGIKKRRTEPFDAVQNSNAMKFTDRPSSSDRRTLSRACRPSP